MKSFPQKRNYRAWFLIFLAITLICAAALHVLDGTNNPQPERIPWPEMKAKIEAGKIAGIELTRTRGGTVRIHGKDDGKKYESEVIVDYERDLKAFLDDHGGPALPQKSETLPSWHISDVISWLFFTACIFLIWSATRGRGLLGRGPLQKVTHEDAEYGFADIAGIDEAKDEVAEVVEFLKHPERFLAMGATLPKGVLLAGPPGTGKTMLAKAVAKEAGVPFFATSGAHFVEMFVGLGASRIRSAFRVARKSAPCVLFIDEVDAVAKSRQIQRGGGGDERDQTLNALLVELDGMESSAGVIVIAATNRRDVLDPALLRPGRMDREVNVPLPDVKGREEILAVHVKRVKMAEDVDLARMARATPGFSGAELHNLVNEAALLAVGQGKSCVRQKELEAARDKVRWGKSRNSMIMTSAQKRIVAVHEAGHTIATLCNPHADPIHKVTIIPRGTSLGSTMVLPETDELLLGRQKCLAMLEILFAGRAAEEIACPDVTSGAAGDLQVAANLARQMSGLWGMSPDHELYFAPLDSNASSQQTRNAADKAARKLMKDAMERARTTLLANKEALEKLAAALLEEETLGISEIQRVCGPLKQANDTYPKNPAE